MAGRLVIMAALKNGAAERVISGDIDVAFVGEDACFNLPIGEARAEGKGNVLMHGLECLKDKGVARGCRFDTVGEGGIDEVNKEGRWKEGDVVIVGVIRGEKVRSVGEGIGTGE